MGDDRGAYWSEGGGGSEGSFCHCAAESLEQLRKQLENKLARISVQMPSLASALDLKFETAMWELPPRVIILVLG